MASPTIDNRVVLRPWWKQEGQHRRTLWADIKPTDHGFHDHVGKSRSNTDQEASQHSSFVAPKHHGLAHGDVPSVDLRYQYEWTGISQTVIKN